MIKAKWGPGYTVEMIGIFQKWVFLKKGLHLFHRDLGAAFP